MAPRVQSQMYPVSLPSTLPGARPSPPNATNPRSSGRKRPPKVATQIGLPGIDISPRTTNVDKPMAGEPALRSASQTPTEEVAAVPTRSTPNPTPPPHGHPLPHRATASEKAKARRHKEIGRQQERLQRAEKDLMQIEELKQQLLEYMPGAPPTPPPMYFPQAALARSQGAFEEVLSHEEEIDRTQRSQRLQWEEDEDYHRNTIAAHEQSCWTALFAESVRVEHSARSKQHKREAREAALKAEEEERLELEEMSQLEQRVEVRLSKVKMTVLRGDEKWGRGEVLKWEHQGRDSLRFEMLRERKAVVQLAQRKLLEREARTERGVHRARMQEIEDRHQAIRDEKERKRREAELNEENLEKRRIADEAREKRLIQEYDLRQTQMKDRRFESKARGEYEREKAERIYQTERQKAVHESELPRHPAQQEQQLQFLKKVYHEQMSRDDFSPRAPVERIPTPDPLDALDLVVFSNNAANFENKENLDGLELLASIGVQVNTSPQAGSSSPPIHHEPTPPPPRKTAATPPPRPTPASPKWDPADIARIVQTADLCPSPYRPQ